MKRKSMKRSSGAKSQRDPSRRRTDKAIRFAAYAVVGAIVLPVVGSLLMLPFALASAKKADEEFEERRRGFEERRREFERRRPFGPQP